MVMSTVAIFTIVINALFLQKGPHPAPIFAARPLLQQETTLPPRLSGTPSHLASDLSAQARVQLIANIQRELSRKGFYDGPADGIWGSKTDAAARDFLQASGLKVNPEANENLLGAISKLRREAGGCRSRAEPAGNGSHREIDCAVQAHRVDTARSRRFRLRTDQGNRRA